MPSPAQTPPELIVLMPVYNEAAIIATVLRDWHATLSQMGLRFELRAYDDGSRDASWPIMQALAAELPQLRVFSAPNSGHGPTILRAYRAAEADFIFQTDSDNEIHSSQFAAIWAERQRADLVIPRRIGRPAPPIRQHITRLTATVLRWLYGCRLQDVNAPFRLYRRSAFAPYFAQLPDDTFAPNLILSGVASLRGLRLRQVPVQCHARLTGEVSIKKWRLAKAVGKALWQTLRFRLALR